MRIWTLTDSRKVDRFPTMKLFFNEEDAMEMKKSFKDDSKYYDIHFEEAI